MVTTIMNPETEMKVRDVFNAAVAHMSSTLMVHCYAGNKIMAVVGTLTITITIV